MKPLLPLIRWGNPITLGLIFNVPLFERGGIQAQDIVRNVYGSFQGTNPTWANGLYGTVLNFGGAGWVGWSAGFTLTTNSVFSILALINPTSVATATQDILSGNVNGGISFRLSTNTLDLVKTGTTDLGASTRTISANVWSLVGVTYSASGVTTFYINGVNAGGYTNAQTFVAFIPQIGQRLAGGNAEFFTGNIAFVSVWKRILVPQEMVELYTNPWQIYATPIRPKLYTGV